MKPWKVLPFIALIISISGFNLTRYSELPPSYPRGHNALIEFISDNLKYPEEAVTNDIEDKVFIEFHVDTDGSITDLKSIKGIGFGCNKESERVMRSSKKWNPGFRDGIAVKAKMTLPFILN